MSHAAKNLFFPEYVVKTLELKGDYEIWAKDIQEYFIVSGYPQHFAAIAAYTEPDVNHDLAQEGKAGDQDKLVIGSRMETYKGSSGKICTKHCSQGTAKDLL